MEVCAVGEGLDPVVGNVNQGCRKGICRAVTRSRFLFSCTADRFPPLLLCRNFHTSLTAAAAGKLAEETAGDLCTVTPSPGNAVRVLAHVSVQVVAVTVLCKHPRSVPTASAVHQQKRSVLSGGRAPQEGGHLGCQRHLGVENKQLGKVVASSDGAEMGVESVLSDVEIHARHAARDAVAGDARGHLGREQRHAAANVVARQLGHWGAGEDGYTGRALVEVWQPDGPQDATPRSRNGIVHLWRRQWGMIRLVRSTAVCTGLGLDTVQIDSSAQTEGPYRVTEEHGRIDACGRKPASPDQRPPDRSRRPSHPEC